MSDRRLLSVTAFVLAASLGLSGCTAAAEPTPAPTPTNVDLSQVDVTDVDRNGVEYLSGQDALDAVLSGMDDAGAVTAVGSFQERPDEDSGGPTRRLQVSLTGTESRFRADIAAADVAVTAVVVDGRAYLTGNPPFAALLGIPEASDGLVCVAADDPRVTAWAPALSPSDLLESMLGEAAGEAAGVTLEPATDPEAVTDSVEFVIGSAGSPIGSLVVATTGPAVPLRLVAADPRGDAEVTFTWGETPEVPEPTDALIPCA
ncbi:hypothetical protein ELQ90_04110 [Labedella phragmitis]|uniref:LppX_LprAFG lipoprotein n=1 Tax=Labedella phragmitis TaxID=2498849 RepID=A0A3S4DJX1_9MICO|nr:hypothetical protein [Labedella phragmitis]RWZ53116.1 hypothetical protein ELQ90_04110 [Labedella phragmitis]